MCGIAGWLDPAGLRDADAQRLLCAMTDAIRHRGPDDAGAWIDAPAGIALGFRRLAILDLSPSGRQPMHSATGRYTIAFNGEIYNFRALRAGLASRGHAFRGTSDTEVLLAAITEWGVRSAVQRCNGMFAFALWDRETHALYLCRDRAGEKPLYYGWIDGTLFFGSELKALCRHPRFRGEVHRDVLAAYLRRGCVAGPHSIYRHVRKLPPGTLVAITAARRDAEPEPYWSWREVAERGAADPFRGSLTEALDELDALLRDAIRLRLESDVPLGAFLSGGIDSSLIVALLQAQADRPVRTFAIGFREERWNEAPYAAAVARHLGTAHTEVYVDGGDALAVVRQMGELYDEPFADSSQIPTFLVSRLAREQVTVCLSGDAGDELFGGYQRYQHAPRLWRALARLPRPARRVTGALARAAHDLPEPAGALLDRLGRGYTGKRSTRDRLRQVSELCRLNSRHEVFNYLRSYWKEPALAVPGASEPGDALLVAGDPLPVPTFEEEMMLLDAVTYLPDDILAKVDRASMAVSLEARIPLLDPRVIAFAARLPLAHRIHHGVGKVILRELAYRYVPRALLDRPKHGFQPPMRVWLRGPLRAWAEELLDPGRLRGDGFFDPAIVQRKLREHLAGRTSWGFDLWCVLMFQVWLAAQRRPAPAPAPGASAPLPL